MRILRFFNNINYLLRLFYCSGDRRSPLRIDLSIFTSWDRSANFNVGATGGRPTIKQSRKIHIYNYEFWDSHLEVDWVYTTILFIYTINIAVKSFKNRRPKAVGVNDK